MRCLTIGVLAMCGFAGATPALPSADTAVAAKKFKNCTALRTVYPHGVGRPGARDRTRRTPVTTFTRNRAVYLKNRGLDRDRDGIACEKR